MLIKIRENKFIDSSLIVEVRYVKVESNITNMVLYYNNNLGCMCQENYLEEDAKDIDFVLDQLNKCIILNLKKI